MKDKTVMPLEGYDRNNFNYKMGRQDIFGSPMWRPERTMKK